MTIQILDGNVLIRSGSIATHEDCCCTPPCLPCPNQTFYCHPDPCGGCLQINSATFEISNSADSSAYSGCDKCDLFNASYYADFTTTQASLPLGVHRWSVFDGFCGPVDLRIKRLTVGSAWRYYQTAVSYTTGQSVGSQLGNASMKACIDFTINKGHVFFVEITEFFDFGFYRLSSGGLINFAGYRVLQYCRSMNNSSAIANCPPDQEFGLCTGISLGELTFLAAFGYRYTWYLSSPNNGFVLDACSELPDYPFCTIPDVDLTALEIEVSAC